MPLSSIREAIMKTSLLARLALVGSLLCFAAAASAGITLGGTRIVLSAPAKEASILVRNAGSEDIMIQSWIETGEKSEKQDVPFAITPPLSRLGAEKQQVLRILYYGQGLPTDQESVFWLAVQEIPQKAKGENTLQIAVRQRVKVFYRPAGLPGKVEDAPGNLKWRLVDRGIEAVNDSPFNVSLTSVKLHGGAKTYAVASEMVGPKSTRTFDVKDWNGNRSSGPLKVEFDSINDYGGLDHHVIDL